MCSVFWNMPRRCAAVLVLLAVQVSAQGRIVLSEFMIEPLATASKSDGTFIEVYNAGNVSVDLLNQNLLLGNFLATIGSSVVVAPNNFAILANVASNTTNGGLPFVSYVLDIPSTWISSAGRLYYGVIGPGGSNLAFQLEWGGSTGKTLPWTPGASLSYNTQKDPNFVNTSDYSNWCVSVTPYGRGTDKGTPGAPNVCVLPPTRPPTRRPTRSPTKSPTKSPSKAPTRLPTKSPTKAPMVIQQPVQRPPTKSPTNLPTKLPTKAPMKRLGPIRRFIRRIFG
jgi:hypothetical protein